MLRQIVLRTFSSGIYTLPFPSRLHLHIYIAHGPALLVPVDSLAFERGGGGSADGWTEDGWERKKNAKRKKAKLTISNAALFPSRLTSLQHSQPPVHC